MPPSKNMALNTEKELINEMRLGNDYNLDKSQLNLEVEPFSSTALQNQASSSFRLNDELRSTGHNQRRAATKAIRDVVNNDEKDVDDFDPDKDFAMPTNEDFVKSEVSGNVCVGLVKKIRRNKLGKVLQNTGQQCKFRTSDLTQKSNSKKTFKCTICEYKCSRSTSLKSHMYNHIGEKPYKCNVCDYKCTRSTKLKKHMCKHGKKPYKCNICQYECITSTQLTVHMHEHTGQKPYKCNICEYKCTQLSIWLRHVRKHTGDKPYKCSVCEHTFSQVGNLKVHMRQHNGEKPYKCNVCKYKCLRRSTLKRHASIHIGDTRYKCHDCSYQCNKVNYLMQHIEEMHAQNC